MISRRPVQRTIGSPGTYHVCDANLQFQPPFLENTKNGLLYLYLYFYRRVFRESFMYFRKSLNDSEKYKIQTLYFSKIPQKNFFRRPAAGDWKETRITLYDFSATSHTGLFLPVLAKSPAAGRRKKFFWRGFGESFWESSEIYKNICMYVFL
jgi:hypothetical protein